MIDDIIDLNKYLKDTAFSGDELSEFLSSEKKGIILILSYIKAKQWPYYRVHFNNEDPEKIFLLLAYLYSDENKKLNLLLDIHPMKCFPSLYNTNNEHKIEYQLQEYKIKNLTLGGCRNIVNIGGKEYTIKQHDYCSAFGLPDDCFSKKFGQSFFETLKNCKDYEIWCFEKNNILQENIPHNISIKFMKDEFLPKKSFFYIDISAKFLTLLFNSKKLSKINECYWYQNGKEFIRERNYRHSEYGLRFEETTIEFIKKKVIFELIRQLLLIKNKDHFKAFSIQNKIKYDEDEKKDVEEKIDKIKFQIQTEYEKYLESLLEMIKPKLNLNKLRSARFLVMDVEFIKVTYPTRITHKNTRTYQFPCIFSSIIWNGKTVEIDLNIFTIPCHYCKKNCKNIKKHRTNHGCIHFAQPFVQKQVTFIEKLLATNESFKIFSYGKSDFNQLEYSDNFFTDSFESRKYHRKNRKRDLDLTKIAQDISKPETSLAEIEEDILMKWLVGWSRAEEHVNVNRNFTTRASEPEFSEKYRKAIETCVVDSISAFLYLLYKDYKKDDRPIKLEKSSQKNLNNDF
jgi:uncharacterized protein YqgV (UPF0045/DUF77 family)